MFDQVKVKKCIHESGTTLPNRCSQIGLWFMKSLVHFFFMLMIVSLAMMRVQSISSILKNSHN